MSLATLLMVIPAVALGAAAEDPGAADAAGAELFPAAVA